MPTQHQLPPELFEIIIEYASHSFQQLLTLQLVCKQFSLLIDDDDSSTWTLALNHQFQSKVDQIAKKGILLDRIYSLQEILSNNSLVKRVAKMYCDQLTFKRFNAQMEREYAIRKQQKGLLFQQQSTLTRSNNQFTVVVIGSKKSGKSSFSALCSSGIFNEQSSDTLYLDRGYIQNGSEIYSVEFNDTSGHHDFDSLNQRRWAILSSSVFIIVYSVANEKSFNAVPGLIEEIKRIRMHSHRHPIIVVGNKIDLHERRQVTSQQLQTLIAKAGRDCKGFEVSVKNRQNIDPVLQEIVRLWRKTNRGSCTIF